MLMRTKGPASRPLLVGSRAGAGLRTTVFADDRFASNWPAWTQTLSIQVLNGIQYGLLLFLVASGLT
jgi:hypothetical protein